jgi:hypothetical protein
MVLFFVDFVRNFTLPPAQFLTTAQTQKLNVSCVVVEPVAALSRHDHFQRQTQQSPTQTGRRLTEVSVGDAFLGERSFPFQSSRSEVGQGKTALESQGLSGSFLGTPKCVVPTYPLAIRSNGVITDPEYEPENPLLSDQGTLIL